MINKDFKWETAFDGGGFRLRKLYIGLNGISPNRFVNRLSKVTIDLENIDLEKLKQKFPNAIINVETIHNERKNSSIEEFENEFDEEDIDEIYFKGTWESSSLTIINGDVFYEIEATDIGIYYNNQDPHVLYEEIFNLLPKKEVKPKEAEINLVVYNSEYYTVRSKIKSTEVSIDENYNDDFKSVYDDIIRFLEDRRCGLIILRGEKGTGNFIKNFCIFSIFLLPLQ